MSDTPPAHIQAILDALIAKGLQVYDGSLDKSGCGFIFVLVIPYGVRNLRWSVVMNAKNISYPPDFIFGENEGYFATLSDVPSISDWAKDPSPLQFMKILDELLFQFKASQVEKIAGLSLDYITEGMELIMSQKNSIIFFEEKGTASEVTISFDFTTEKFGITGDSEGQLKGPDLPNLHITIKPFEQSVIQGKVAVPKSLFHGLFPSIIETWDPATPFSVFFSKVRSSVDAEVSNLVKYQDVKISLVSHVTKHFPIVLEYDSRNFSFISVVFENMFKDALNLILKVVIPSQFPQQKPELVVYAIGPSLLVRGAPKQIHYTDFPYSPRWTPEELVSRIIAFLNDKMQDIRRELSQSN